MPHCAFVSFRLGGSDGVSVVASTWEDCLRRLGWTTSTVAGEGNVDHLISGLAIGAAEDPDETTLDAALSAALDGADLVVAENILTIPMNLPASRAVARCLAGRRAVLHHHDPPWQRERFAHITELPADDPAWLHVTINELTRGQFATRGLEATTIYNGFDTDAAPGDRARTRETLGVGPDQVLVAHPVRAIARKNIPAALQVTEAVDGVYWLPGPAEEDYAQTLDAVLASTDQPVLRTTLAELGPDTTMADLYAAADLVVFPSTWEGFGNPPMEAAIHRRPVVIGTYPVASELRALGFHWIDVDDIDAMRRAATTPDPVSLARNRALVERHFSLDVVTRGVHALVAAAGF